MYVYFFLLIFQITNAMTGVIYELKTYDSIKTLMSLIVVLHTTVTAQTIYDHEIMFMKLHN